MHTKQNKTNEKTHAHHYYYYYYYCNYNYNYIPLQDTTWDSITPAGTNQPTTERT